MGDHESYGESYAVEPKVIRCRDCKKYKKPQRGEDCVTVGSCGRFRYVETEVDCGSYVKIEKHVLEVGPEDYCSKGKRK